MQLCFLALYVLIAACLQEPTPTIKSQQSDAPAKHVMVDQSSFVSFNSRSFSMWGSSSFGLTKTGMASHSVSKRRLNRDSQHFNWRLTDGELTQFLCLMDAAKFPELKHDYRERGLFDAAITESTLTVKAPDNKVKSYTVRVYGNTAPAPYYDLMRFLWKLESKQEDAANHRAGK